MWCQNYRPHSRPGVGSAWAVFLLFAAVLESNKRFQNLLRFLVGEFLYQFEFLFIIWLLSDLDKLFRCGHGGLHSLSHKSDTDVPAPGTISFLLSMQ